MRDGLPTDARKPLQTSTPVLLRALPKERVRDVSEPKRRLAGAAWTWLSNVATTRPEVAN
jgi:hypothetical protein